MNFVTLGLFSFNTQGIEGSLLLNVKSWISFSRTFPMCWCFI